MERRPPARSARVLLALAAAAFALRVGFACLTHVAPIFPAYYYADAELIDSSSWKLAQAWRTGSPHPTGISSSHRIQTRLIAPLYYAFGHAPLLAKLLHCAAGASALLLLTLAIETAFGATAAAATLLLAGAWPSHVFFTSQLFKDPLAMLCAYAALALLLPALSGPWDRRVLAQAAAGLAALMALALLRAYVMAVLATALSLGALRRLPGPDWRTRAARAAAFLAFLAAAAVSAIVLRQRLAAATLPLQYSATSRGDSAQYTSPLSLATDSAQLGQQYPFTPQGIAALRSYLLLRDRGWADSTMGRSISTQLFPDLKFDGWRDLLIFLPKGMFYVLFMPLPLLYPMGHNLGRALAAGENLFLLLLAAAAARGLLRARWTPERTVFLGAFLLMAIGSAVLEFDLGSATRHKTFYLPLLFPFAFVAAARGPSPGGRRRIYQVVECGGPGGTGQQVAALCNGLDPSLFETTLVYGARPGTSPDAYRALAQGAADTVYLPDLVREVSPPRDLRALIALYRLFQAGRPDVVHAHSSKAGVLARLAARAAGVPAIYYSPRGYAFQMLDRGAASRALYRAFELSVSWIGEVVAVSPSEAELARPLTWGKAIHVVCDPYLGSWPEPSGHSERKIPRIGAAGRLTYARHPEAFVRLARRVAEARPEARLIWIGDGESGPAVRAETRELGPRLEWTGWLERDTALRKLSELDVFVHLSRWEGLPNAVLDAMAAGLPVVATDISGNRDAVVDGETGYLVRDESEAFDRVLRLLDDPTLRRRLGEAGRRRVRSEFSRERALADLERLYRAEA